MELIPVIEKIINYQCLTDIYHYHSDLTVIVRF